MSDRADEKLEALLKARRVEAPSADLAERIILKARVLPQKRAPSLVGWLRQAFAELHLPQPAYVLASTLVLGLLLGFTMPRWNGPDDLDQDQVQSFLSADEDVP